MIEISSNFVNVAKQQVRVVQKSIFACNKCYVCFKDEIAILKNNIGNNWK